ncbi:unnamed protein product, partial [Ectocarpus sp. 12 AP-2014]
MKNRILLIAFVALFYSCAETPKENSNSEVDSENIDNSDENQSKVSAEDLEDAFEQLGGVFNTDNENEADDNKSKLPEVEALEKLLQMSGMGGQGTTEAFQDLLTKDISASDMISSEAIIALLEQSGVSREEMEKLINNPDSLRILTEEAVKTRKLEQQEKETYLNKGKLSKEQLSSKNTSTGVSLEEAILLVQAESGPEATMAKLKKIDSLAGTNVMEKLDLTEAGYVMRDIERKNEAPPSAAEVKKMEMLQKLTGQLHSDKEANTVLDDLEQEEIAITSGTLKASPKYKQAIAYRKKIAQVFQRDFARKAKAAKRKFQQLNPNLFFGEETGQ